MSAWNVLKEILAWVIGGTIMIMAPIPLIAWAFDGFWGLFLMPAWVLMGLCLYVLTFQRYLSTPEKPAWVADPKKPTRLALCIAFLVMTPLLLQVYELAGRADCQAAREREYREQGEFNRHMWAVRHMVSHHEDKATRPSKSRFRKAASWRSTASSPTARVIKNHSGKETKNLNPTTEKRP